MSFFGIGRPQPSSAEKIAAVEAEMRFITDMANRMSKACSKKCLPTDYREGELNKGESVCLDRCASKFFDVHQKVSEIMQGEAQQRAGATGLASFGG